MKPTLKGNFRRRDRGRNAISNANELFLSISKSYGEKEKKITATTRINKPVKMFGGS